MPKLICGLMGTSVASGSSSMSGSNNLKPFLQMLTQHSIKELDTARVYNAGKSEEELGTIPSAQQNFLIATKAPGFSPGSLTYDKIIENCSKSLTALKQDRIGLYYFHGPDRETKVEESCRAINDLFKEGRLSGLGFRIVVGRRLRRFMVFARRTDGFFRRCIKGGIILCSGRSRRRYFLR